MTPRTAATAAATHSTVTKPSTSARLAPAAAARKRCTTPGVTASVATAYPRPTRPMPPSRAAHSVTDTGRDGGGSAAGGGTAYVMGQPRGGQPGYPDESEGGRSR